MRTLSQAVTHFNKQLTLPVGKFIEILNSNELNMGQEANDYMIMEMLKDSDGVASLNFKRLQEMVWYYIFIMAEQSYQAKCTQVDFDTVVRLRQPQTQK